MVQLKFKLLRPRALLPFYATSGAAGMDIRFCPENNLARVLEHNEIALAETGLAVEVPEGYELQCRPRSGLATQGIAVNNAPGTIDSDYRGEIKVILINHGGMTLISPGDRIAQLVLAKTPKLEIVEVDELSDTARGEGGFGSTGL